MFTIIQGVVRENKNKFSLCLESKISNKIYYLLLTTNLLSTIKPIRNLKSNAPELGKIQNKRFKKRNCCFLSFYKT